MTQTQPPSPSPLLPSPVQRPPRPQPTAILLTAALLCSIVTAMETAERFAGLDFYQFWVTAQVLQQSPMPPSLNVYSQQARQTIGQHFAQLARTQSSDRRQQAAASARQNLETFSTPFLYTTFVPISSPNYTASYRFFALLCVAAMVVSVVLLCRLLGYGWSATILAVVVLILSFEPFQFQMAVLNVNPLQLMSLALFLAILSRPPAIPWRDLAAGAVLGLSLLYKPNIAPVVALPCLLWLIDRRFARLLRCIAGMLLGGAAAVAISSWQFGTHRCWLDWLQAIRSLEGQKIISVAEGNYTLAQWVSEHTSISPSTVSFALVLVLLPACLFAMWRSRPAAAQQPDLHRTVLAVGLGATLALLVAPLSWVHYYIFNVPLILYLLRPRPLDDETPQLRWPRQIAGIVVIAFGLVHAVVLVEWDALPLRAPLYILATLALLLAALREASASRTRSPLAPASDTDLPIPAP